VSKPQISSDTKMPFSDSYTIIQGDSRIELANIADSTFQCCVTSPPYWGLRDYDTDNQIGAENCLEDYISNLVLVFREVRRVLTDDGTLWLNIGDSYTSGNRTWRDSDKKNQARGMDYSKIYLADSLST
jgi:site-specific DNA-methyltransferase (adenine-specific)/site-specific DNA-methyltransferase (cytosine-N4-specific)